MPTSVSIVRQCLAIESVHALDEAVTVARRRGHGQTTSLHLVSSLLSLPSSPLREACSRIRNDAFTMRIQFKALELCLGVSLDRLPSALSGAREQEVEPPVSNSLMAAIKRSQANQRRQPENFSFYQQQMLSSSSSSAVNVVKVELRNLILSILDDPVVSRVFGDAGFRSCEIKMGILRQVHQLFRYSRNKWPRDPPPPPLFLCNLNGDNNLLRRKGFSFPFMGFSEFPDCEENGRRIAEVMEKNDGDGRRNPLLVGACAFDSLKSFLGMIQGRRERSGLPMKLSGLSVISLEDDILRFVTGKYEECLMKLKFEEVGKTVGNCVAPGVVINFGDLKTLACDYASIDTLRFIVSELTKLLEIHGSKVWLIGAAATYEAYLKFSQMFPSAEMDLDLQLLPITSTGVSMARSYPKSSSFRRQFRCHLCEEKCQQEVITFSDVRVSDSVAASIPPLPHVAERSRDGGFHVALASKDRAILTAKISGLHKKWDNICQHLHYGQQFPKPSDFIFSPCTGAENINPESDSSFQENSPLRNKRIKTIPMDAAASGSSSPTSFLPTADLNKISLLASSIDSLESSDGNGLISPVAVASASTDLNLELNTASTKSSRSNFCSDERLDQRDFKLLYTSLAKRIGWQEEAVKVISESIVQCRTTTEKQSKSNRGNIWFSFLGPDQLGKRKLAIALAEILYGNQENLIHLDLSSSNSMLNLEDKESHHVFRRGRNVVDYIADELRKKPLSVVLLENIEKADVLLQQSLSHAVKNGRFLDSDGREISISNTIFVTTSAAAMDGTRKLHSKTAIYSEVDVSSVKSCPIHITIGIDLREKVECDSSGSILMNKRKHEGKTETIKQIGHHLELTKRVHRSSDTNLDLNIPPEDVETEDQDSTFENNAKWVRDFVGQAHAKVVFQPFDFDDLADNILKDVSDQFQKTIGSECCLEIDYRVMMQMISAGYIDTYKSVEDWAETVLKNAFEEAQEKYSLSSCSIVKLVAGEGTIAREQFLPSKITVH